MKIKTSVLTLEQLNWAVATCEGYTPLVHSHLATVMVERRNARGVMQPEHLSSLRYSTDWELGGPIIEQEGISLLDPTGNDIDAWRAYCGGHLAYGPTPLIAAMRCYVASKLGDEVEVPEELS